MADSLSMCCGICLSDGGRASRGYIDCCDHYFCFVCIMEWAKVESRCPMCKRRFSTIRRLPKEGVFPCQRLVDVPVRDQARAFHPLGNITIGPSDPYAEVRCCVCNGQEDENFLLLCDLCNSAAHTFCIGLGATVPEGDWFCHDCTVSRDEHAEMDSHCDSQNPIPAADAIDSTFDIVDETNSPKIQRSSVGVSSQSQLNLQSSPNVPNTGSLGSQVNEPNERAPQIVVDKVTDSDARTLQRCRNVHSRIRELRENWNALRSGSLIFSSGAVFSSRSNSKKDNIGSVLHGRSGQPSFSSSTSSQILTTQNSFSSCNSPRRVSDDIDKAWKIMEIAKSKLQAQERINRVHQASKISLLKRKASNEGTVSDSSHFASKSQQSRIRDLGNIGTEMQYKCCSYDKQIEKFKSPNLDKQKQRRFYTKGIVGSNGGLPSSSLPRDLEFPSSADGQTSIQNTENGVKLVQESFGQGSVKEKGAISTVINEPHGSACLISLVGSVSGASDSFHAKRRPVISSTCHSKGKCGLEKIHAEGMARKDNAKSDIQSLVKLNLKLLSSGQQLGVDAFKEIARLSTHTILAACGLEHRKAGSHCFATPPVCNHIENSRHLSKSTLMPNCCRECFFVYVKDVVNSIMVEKVS